MKEIQLCSKQCRRVGPEQKTFHTLGQTHEQSKQKTFHTLGQTPRKHTKTTFGFWFFFIGWFGLFSLGGWALGLKPRRLTRM